MGGTPFIYSYDPNFYQIIPRILHTAMEHHPGAINSIAFSPGGGCLRVSKHLRHLQGAVKSMGILRKFHGVDGKTQENMGISWILMGHTIWIPYDKWKVLKFLKWSMTKSQAIFFKLSFGPSDYCVNSRMGPHRNGSKPICFWTVRWTSSCEYSAPVHFDVNQMNQPQTTNCQFNFIVYL